MARKWIKGLCFAALFGFQSSFALPINWLDGDVTGALDTTLTLGMGIRTQDRDNSNIGVGNGGSYPTLNEDDGNLNYDQWDPYSVAFRSVTEFLLNYKDFTFFTRISTIYDFLVMHGDTARTPLTHVAKNQIGSRIRLLDLYLNFDRSWDDRFLTIRVGSQVLNWGESTFIPNGLNVLNPFDLARFRTAGSEIREALIPVPMIRVDYGFNENFSAQVFWQFIWMETELDPKGTFFSTNDFVSPGADFAMITTDGTGTDTDFCIDPGTCANPALFGQSARRGPTRKGEDFDNAGISFRYYAPQLNETEFGLYLAWYASRVPLISAYAGTSNLALGAAARIPDSYYFTEYPSHLWVTGISFNTMVGQTAIQGEYSLHLGQPLQIDDQQLLANVLGGSSQLDPVPVPAGDNTEIKGWRRKSYSQAQFTLTRSFGPKFKADDLVLVAEVAATFVHDLPKKATLQFEAPGTPYGHGHGDPFAMGYRTLLRATYNNAIGPVNLIPSWAFGHDFGGTLPTPLSTFVANRMQTTLRLDARYLSFLGTVAYTAFFNGGVHHQLRDRDFLTLSGSYSF